MSCLCNLFSEKLLLRNSEPFIVQRRLAFGGFSTIDLVTSEGEKFVVKRICCFSQEDEQKAEHEGDVHSSLPLHPNILPCFSYTRLPSPTRSQGAISEILLLLPRCKGGSLQSRLENLKLIGSYLETSVIIQILEGIVLALETLFNQGLAHRDLKPGNILFSSLEDNTPLLMDFGSVTAITLCPSTRSETGKLEDFVAENCSLPYRAPELFQITTDAFITEKADLWSLGCVLYALCFYEAPFDQMHVAGDSIALAVISGLLRFPPNWPFEYPKAVLDLIRQLLQQDPSKRPSTGEIKDFIKSWDS